MRRAPFLLAALLSLALAASAAAQSPVFEDFKQDGVINPCAYSPQQLQNELNNLPPDVAQYAPGLADQLGAGRLGCGGGGGAPVQVQTEQGTPIFSTGGGGGQPPKAKPEVPAPPGPKEKPRGPVPDIPTPAATNTTAPGIDSPGWLIPMLIALAGVGALGTFAAWFFGWSPERYTRPIGASLSEAGGRTADALATLWDYVRFGR